MPTPMSRLKILGYHNVGVAPPKAKSPDLYVSQDSFARQMWLLKRAGVRGVSITEAIRNIREETSTNCIAITFDDGYADNLEVAAPILKDFGFSATCYIVSDCIGEYNRWDAEKLCVSKPLMTYEQVESWLAHGMEIGSHTRTHSRLDLLTRENALQEIVGSKEALTKITGRPIDNFCYPYGRYDEATVQLVKEAGYVTATTTKAGSSNTTSDPFQLPRIFVGGRTGSLKYSLKLLLGL